MSRVQFKVTSYYSHGTETHLEDTIDPVIEKVVSPISNLNQLDLQDDTYISVYDRKKHTSFAYIGHFAHDWIGDYAEIDYTKRTHDIDLLIDGQVYDYSYLLEHFIEVKALIEDIHTEKVIQEIDD